MQKFRRLSEESDLEGFEEYQNDCDRKKDDITVEEFDGDINLLLHESQTENSRSEENKAR